MIDEKESRKEKSPLEIVMEQETADDISNALSELTNKQRNFIEKYFGLNGRMEMNQPKIAKHYGCDRANVNHFIGLGLEELRNNNELRNSL